ncbi:VOC family protein [Halapricum salinum]|uniref:Fosmidomycin resistance protein n=1 Tax=Halapricum salinum TaxID=1457250 RepID=A0A4D6HE58_9EURY|nr:VOC family protein [Halapricum salinum]QCC51831.1 fosmidomycin resistance protein [Halapricum salinum]
MLGSCGWVALEAKHREPVVDFYRTDLDLPVVRRTETETVLDAGDTELVIRRPGAVPRGGVHTHYAFSIPSGEYETWWNRLDSTFELVEAVFGDARSLYLDDPADNCVELGQRDIAGPGIDGIFELVLEVADLERATGFYTDLGFEVVDRGDERRRIRLTTGELDLELWEPQLGIADGRGGVHVDWGLRTDDPGRVIDRVRERTRAAETVEKGIRILDPDGHYLTLMEAQPN